MKFKPLIKSLILSFLTLGALFLAGCSPSEPTSTSEGAFIGGTQGITAQFEAFGVEEDSVYSIFDSDTFQIEITLNNKGEYEIQTGDIKVELLGPSMQEFGGIPSWALKNKEVIDPISDLVTSGGQETLNFASDAKFIGKVTGLLNRKWHANIEYNYQTQVLVPEVCLKEDLTDERVCEVKEDKQFFVSGAPITVTSVQEDVAGKGIMALTFVVKNVGGGDKVTKVGETFGATDKLSFQLDDTAWECKSAGKVNEARLIDGQAEIFCKLNNPLASCTLSVKQVKLTLDYIYRDSIQEDLRIKESVK